MVRIKKRKKLFWIIGLGLLPFVVLGVFYLSLPPVRVLKHMNPVRSAFMARQYGEKGPRIRWTYYNEISPLFIRALLIAEDDKFFHHSGFDLDSIRRSLDENLRAGRLVSGASTITQQLAKNLYLSTEKTWLRKAREALITLKLENRLSKKRILELYMNLVEFGPDVFGVYPAAEFFFQKTPARLGVEESIRLVSVLPYPHKHSPRSNADRRLNARRRIILKRMFEREWMDSETYRRIRGHFLPDSSR